MNLLDKSELAIRRAHLLTDDHQEENCRQYLHYTNAGAATNVLNEELGGFTLSQQSARYIHQKRQDSHYGIMEELPITKKGGSSTANHLVVLLDKLARDGHIRYVALYHEVKETTLLAIISKATEKSWKKEVQKVRTDAANGLLTLSQMDDDHNTTAGQESQAPDEEPFLNESLDLSIISDSNCHDDTAKENCCS